MAELGFKLDLDVASSASQGGRIETGIYVVEIIKAYVYKTDNGNNIVDLELRSNNGEVGFINRLCIDQKWESGSDNLDYKRWQELAASAQMQSLTTFESTRKTKNGEVQVAQIKELVGKKIQVAVYREFDVYNNEEKVSLKLSNTFLADGRSVSEAQAKKPAERIDKIGGRLVDYHTKEHKAWKGGATTATSAPVESVAEPVAQIDDAEANALFG